MIVGNYQSELRKNKSTIDHIFVIRQFFFITYIKGCILILIKINMALESVVKKTLQTKIFNIKRPMPMKSYIQKIIEDNSGSYSRTNKSWKIY
jgi:hypothetical protein